MVQKYRMSFALSVGMYTVMERARELCKHFPDLAISTAARITQEASDIFCDALTINLQAERNMWYQSLVAAARKAREEGDLQAFANLSKQAIELMNLKNLPDGGLDSADNYQPDLFIFTTDPKYLEAADKVFTIDVPHRVVDPIPVKNGGEVG